MSSRVSCVIERNKDRNSKQRLYHSSLSSRRLSDCIHTNCTLALPRPILARHSYRSTPIQVPIVPPVRKRVPF
jgi:hypothetical protein